MAINFITRPPEIAGAYILDPPSKPAPTQKGQNYWVADNKSFLPLMNLVQLTDYAELQWADSSDAGNTILTHIASSDNYNNSASVKVKNRIDLSAGDLLVGGVRMVLNFMPVPLTIKTRSDIPKLFAPLALNPQLTDFHNKIVVLSFHSFNTPQHIKEATGLVNYFENLRLEKTQRGEGNSTPVRMLDYLSRCWKDFKPETCPSGVPNSIKLAMIHLYTPADFMLAGVEYKDVYCSESGLLIRRTDKVLETAAHPKLNDSLLANKQIVQSMRDNGMSCFIVDNDRLLNERFINFAGQVRQIPQVVDKHRPQGLYITSINGDKSLEADSFVPLERIDESPYIYKSQEEAKLGTDIRTQTEQAHELNKLELGIEATRLKHQYDEQIRRMDLEAKRRQVEFETHSREMETRYQESLRNMQISLEDRKKETQQDKYRFDVMGMQSKHQYESVKYERDATIETLKTVGSIAGLMAGGYVLFKQLSK